MNRPDSSRLTEHPLPLTARVPFDAPADPEYFAIVAKKTRQDEKTPDAASPIEFEEAVDQLEKIIDSIESGEAGLERSIREYERGMELIRHCRSILDQAEQRVRELSTDAPDERPAADEVDPDNGS